jgi:hypothetical protein
MSLKTTREGNSFESVPIGGTATCRLPIGLSYEKISLPYGGTTFDPTHMEEIRVVANGEVIRRYRDVAKLDTINKFDRLDAASTDKILVLPFTRNGCKTRAGKEYTMLGTGFPTHVDGKLVNPNPITTLALEIDVAPTAVAPTLGSPVLHQDEPRPTGMILKTKQYYYSPQGAGIFDISDLPKGELVNRIFFFGANIKSLEIIRDNFTAFKRTKAMNERFQRDGVRTPQAGLFVYDPTEEGLGSEALVTRGVHDLRFRLDMTGAENIEVIVETISTLAV